MDHINLGIIGCGNMGRIHIDNILAGKCPKIKIAAICDINEKKLASALEKFPEDYGVAAFTDYMEMIRSGKVDSIIIAVPHYYHPGMAIKGFENGMHVISEKPIGVFTKAIHPEIEAAKKSGKVFGMMFNQRTNPMYIKMREIIQSGELGEITRANWIITNWFRTQYYYDSGDWRATWSGEGGGVLLNQCPHQIDLMQWICGMPKRVRAFAYEGKYHNIEVEDDVTAYYEYENGATGLFITTTGEYPGTNRFEVSGDKGKLIAENNKLTHIITKDTVSHARETLKEGFAHIECEEKVYEFDNDGGQHSEVLNRFADAVLEGKPLIANGEEGINGLTVSNAMHLSAWTGDWVDIPFDEDKYYSMLQERIKNSKFRKPESDGIVFDASNSFGGAK